MANRFAAFAGAAALWMPASATAHDPEPEFLSPQQVVAEVRQCGFVDVETRYEAVLESDVITVAVGQPATDAQVDCAARTSFASPQYIFEMPDGARERFFATLGLLYRPIEIERATRELASREDLGPPPAFDRESQTPEEFALKIEEYCGDHAKGILQSEFGPNTVNPNWPQGQMPEAAQIAALGCVYNVAALVDFDLGFMGNGKAAE